MMNVISCCWNTMAVAVLDFSHKISKVSVPTSNLT
jgi:hypothetical protein